MSYGLTVSGSDGAGTFIVADTNKDLVNFQIVEVGRASSVTLDAIATGTSRYIFVKNPGTLRDYYNYNWSSPTVTFKGYDILQYQDEGITLIDQYDNPATITMDYIVVQDISQYATSGETYGLQINSAAGSLIFDSRRVQTNEVLEISQAISADTTIATSPSNGPDVATLTGINTSTDYINIEWAAYPGPTTLRGIGDLYTTSPDMLDAEIDEYQSGDEYFVNYGQAFAFLAVNLG